MCLTIQIMSLDVHDERTRVNKKEQKLPVISEGEWHRFRSHHALTLFTRSFFLHFRVPHIPIDIK